MPTKYGDGSTADRRPDSWQQKGVWNRILSGLIKTDHKQGKISLQNMISVDSSTIPAPSNKLPQFMLTRDMTVRPLETI